MTAISTDATDTTTLTPSYRLPAAMVATALLIAILPVKTGGIGIILALLGLFLLYQTTTIRLVFTATSLEVRRNDSLLKTFPYAEWESWKIFYSPVPILFYFKEVNSIHFLPVLFNPTELRECLEAHTPHGAV